MKLSDLEKKDLLTPNEAPKYPQGLCVYLGPEELEKLGIQKAPEVGKEYMLLAKAVVVNAGLANKEEGEYRMELQLQELDLKAKEKDAQPADKVLYGE